MGFVKYQAAFFSISQEGKTRTAGWHLRARAKTLARSTPKLILSFSIAEMVDWGIPVARARSSWLISCNSRIIRTDSPTVTLTLGLAFLNPFLIVKSPFFSVLVRRDIENLNEQLSAFNPVKD